MNPPTMSREKTIAWLVAAAMEKYDEMRDEAERRDLVERTLSALLWGIPIEELQQHFAATWAQKAAQ